MSSSYLTEHTFRCLTDEQIAHIQVDWLDNGATQVELAAEYGVSIATISKVCRSIPKKFYKPNRKAMALENKRLRKRAPKKRRQLRLAS